MPCLAPLVRATQCLLAVACALGAATARGQSCVRGTLADEFVAADAGLVREWILQVPFDSGASRLESVVVGEGLAVAQSGDGGLHAIRTAAGAGTIAWSRAIPAAMGHAWQPTVGSRLVVLTSGMAIHALARDSGAEVWERHAGEATGAAAVQSGDWVHAPLAGGRVLRLPVDPFLQDGTPAAGPETPRSSFAVTRGARILIAGADTTLCESLRGDLAADDYRVEHVRSGAGGLRSATHETPDLVVIDLELPDALDTLTALFARASKSRFVPCVALRSPGKDDVVATLKQFVKDSNAEAAKGGGPPRSDIVFMEKPAPTVTAKEFAERVRAIAALARKTLPRHGRMHVASAAGRLLRIDLPGTRVAWSVTLPDRPDAAPLVAGDVVFISLGPSGIAAYATADGRELWRTGLAGTLVAATGRRVWLLDEVGRLTALDIATGSRLLSACVGGFTLPVVNTTTERLVLASPGGVVVSLAEPGARRRDVSDGDRDASAPAPAGPAATTP